ncbi:hypothetical protein ACO0RG_002518 [Hanseniaspora osmophila]|uniref:V-SNARE coiled-coil homology domain-containing protein n=1 Tax=Hanseniaspora osmophila TaxID=56408 RepID=A0A1E5RVM4_9ASCO|nr:hypothetical protein AWRI3579_g376 [Hanseniaspora osmophila]
MSNRAYEYHIVYYCLVRVLQDDSTTATSREIVHDYFKSPSSTQYSSIIDKNLSQQLLQKLVVNNIDFPQNQFDITLLARKYIENYQIFVRQVQHLNAYQLVISSKNTPKSLSIKLLESLNSLNSKNLYKDIENFEKNYNQEVSKQIQETVPNASKITDDMDQLITIMNDNIDKVLLRNDQLDSLVNKTNKLNNSGVNFKRKTVVIKRKMWIQKVKTKAAIGTAIVLAIGGTALYAAH